MIRKFLITSSVLLLTACSANTNTAGTTADDHSQHSVDSSQGTSQDRLANSPRHGEWIEINSGGKTIYTWVVYPETTEKVPVVLLIHENRGLNDWARGMADQIAEAGYIAVAPDLLSDFSDTEKRTSDFKDEDAARTALGTLKPEDVQSDLQSIVSWAQTIPASNEQVAVAGFCWGGAQAFELATKNDELDMAMVFYGTGPTDANAYKNIDVPVIGFYGGADERVNATIATSEAAMKAAGKTFEYEIYDGAGHAFMRSGEDPNGEAANVAARNAAWERMKQKLETLNIQ